MIYNQTFTIFRQDFEYDANNQPVIGKDGQKKMVSLNLGNLQGIVTKHTAIPDPLNNSIIIGQRVFSRVEPNSLELKAGDLVVVDDLKLEVETISPIYWADGTIWQYTLIMKTNNTTLYA
jgi:hypothetical protein